MDRRQFAAALGGTTLTAVAGCVGDDGSTGSDASTGDGEGQSLDEHPAGAGVGEQPRRGDLGGHVVMAFEDPSCPRCAAFERDVVPQIRENLVADGSGAFVARSYPVVYPWGEPATAALEAAFARDESAFWALQDHYFSNQDSFSEGDVLGRTAAFLTEETGVDGDAVVTAVEEGEAEAAVQTDVDAAEAAGLPESTPQVLLFRDGTYETTVSGSVSYDAIAAALGES